MPPEPEEFEDLPSTPVGAGFFGEGGTAQPLRDGNARSLRGGITPSLRNNGEPSLGDLDQRERPPVDWAPGKRRTPPPRQKPMFRPPDDEIEETTLSRVTRALSSVLSFGLYAAVAGAVLLVFWNLRTPDWAAPPPPRSSRRPLPSFQGRRPPQPRCSPVRPRERRRSQLPSRRKRPCLPLNPKPPSRRS